MGETINIANCLLILGIGYFYFVYHLDISISILGIVLAVISWSYHGFTKERGKLFEAKINLLNSKSEYYKRKEVKEESATDYMIRKQKE